MVRAPFVPRFWDSVTELYSFVFIPVSMTDTLGNHF